MECQPTPQLEEMDPNILGDTNVNTFNDLAKESASSSSNSCYSDNQQESESESKPNKQQLLKATKSFSNVHFRNTTKNIAAHVLYSELSVNFTLSLLKVSFPQTMSLSCIFVFAPSFIRMDLSFVTSSTSLTFPEFLVLFSFIESHFALSSARCHL